MLIKEEMIDQLHVTIYSDRSEMGKSSGSAAAARISTLLKEKEFVNIMFAAAPSQNETLAALCSDEGIDWSRINAFHMDEYVGLDPKHPACFRNYLKNAIFAHYPFHEIHLIRGEAADVEAEAERYSHILEDYPLDICMLGIGENGHIAFNDPWVADFHDLQKVKLVQLDDICRMQQVHDGCFAQLIDVPESALTVTIPALCNAAWMYCSVPSATKAKAVQTMLTGEISEKCPASILRMHPHAELFLDVDSGEYLL